MAGYNKSITNTVVVTQHKTASNHPAKCTNLYNMQVLPNRQCPSRGQLLIFFNQSVGSIACYVTRQVGTLNAINHHTQRCPGTSDPQQQIVIKML